MENSCSRQNLLWPWWQWCRWYWSQSALLCWNDSSRLACGHSDTDEVTNPRFNGALPCQMLQTMTWKRKRKHFAGRSAINLLPIGPFPCRDFWCRHCIMQNKTSTSAGLWNNLYGTKVAPHEAQTCARSTRTMGPANYSHIAASWTWRLYEFKGWARDSPPAEFCSWRKSFATKKQKTLRTPKFLEAKA